MQFESLNENYIRTYDDIITKDLCDELISEFERSETQFDKQVLKDHRSFTQIAFYSNIQTGNLMQMNCKAFLINVFGDICKIVK